MVDSISKTLPPPVTPGFSQGSLLADVVSEIEEWKETGNSVLKVVINAPTKELRDLLAVLEQEQMKALQEATRAAHTLSEWSFGSLISSILYGSASIIGGAYLIREKNDRASGQHFVAAGSLLLFNALLSYRDRWGALSRFLSLGNPTVEQILHIGLPLALNLFSSAWNARNLAKLPEDHKKKLNFIGNLFAFVNLAIEVGRFYTKWKQGQAERQLLNLERKMSTINLKITELQSERQNLSGAFKRVENGLKRVAENYINLNADLAKNT